MKENRGRGKKTEIEQIWARRGGQKLQELYTARKKRGKLNSEMLGEALGFSKKGRVSSIRNLMKGKAHLPPEYIQRLAKKLSLYGEKETNERPSPLELESQLAVASGQQMPSLLSLEEDALSGTLEAIGRFSLLALNLAPKEEDAPATNGDVWPLVMEELNQVIRVWLEIGKLEKLIVADQPVGLHFDKLDNRWERLSTKLDALDFPLQSAYARVLWARSLAWAGNTRLADDLARRTLENLNSVPLKAKEVAWMKYQAHVIRASNARARGTLDEAIKHYDLAAMHAPGDKDLHRLTIKKVNTYLLGSVRPPRHLLEHVRLASRDSEHVDLRVRALYSLAWLKRSRRGSNIREAIRYGEEGITLAKEYGNDHRAAVGNQYLGESLLHFGDFTRAKSQLIIAAEFFHPPRYGRRGFTRYLLGRAHAYTALQAWQLKDNITWKKEIKNAMELFEFAECEFRRGFLRQFGYGYQRKQLLLEQAKWEALAATIEALKRYQHMDSVTADKLGRKLQEARQKLDETEEIGWSEDSFRGEATRLVNGLIIDFLEWTTIQQGNNKIGEQLEIKGSELLQRFDDSPQMVRGVHGENYFERSFYGHLALIHAIRGAVRWKMGLSGDIAHNDIRKSKDRAGLCDFLAVLDCRFILSLALNRTDRRRAFDAVLPKDVRERLSEFDRVEGRSLKQ